MCANREGSGETVWMRRLASAFAGRLYDKYNVMIWLIYVVIESNFIALNSYEKHDNEKGFSILFSKCTILRLGPGRRSISFSCDFIFVVISSPEPKAHW